MVVHHVNRHHNAFQQQHVFFVRVHRQFHPRILEDQRGETRTKSILDKLRDCRRKVKPIALIQFRRHATQNVEPGDLLLYLLRVARRLDAKPAKLIALIHLRRRDRLHVGARAHFAILPHDQVIIAKLVIKLQHERQGWCEDFFFQYSHSVGSRQYVDLLLVGDFRLTWLLLRARRRLCNQRRVDAQGLEDLRPRRPDNFQRIFPQRRKLGEFSRLGVGQPDRAHGQDQRTGTRVFLRVGHDDRRQRISRRVHALIDGVVGGILCIGDRRNLGYALERALHLFDRSGLDRQTVRPVGVALAT